jgi:AcrR family transcriptional regulator
MESTQERILKISAKIIASEGYDAISIRHVCDKAGVKAPTVYYYFKDKDGLIDAVINLAYQRHIETYAKYVKDKSPLKGVIKTWEAFFDFVDQNPDLYHAIVVAHLKQRIPSAGLELYRSIEQIFKQLDEEKKLKVPYKKAAQIFYATAYGQALVYVSQGSNPELKPHIRLTRDICLQGLLASSAPG